MPISKKVGRVELHGGLTRWNYIELLVGLNGRIYTPKTRSSFFHGLFYERTIIRKNLLVVRQFLNKSTISY